MEPTEIVRLASGKPCNVTYSNLVPTQRWIPNLCGAVVVNERCWRNLVQPSSCFDGRDPIINAVLINQQAGGRSESKNESAEEKDPVWGVRTTKEISSIAKWERGRKKGKRKKEEKKKKTKKTATETKAKSGEFNTKRTSLQQNLLNLLVRFRRILVKTTIALTLVRLLRRVVITHPALSRAAKPQEEAEALHLLRRQSITSWTQVPGSGKNGGYSISQTCWC